MAGLIDEMWPTLPFIGPLEQTRDEVRYWLLMPEFRDALIAGVLGGRSGDSADAYVVAVVDAVIRVLTGEADDE